MVPPPITKIDLCPTCSWEGPTSWPLYKKEIMKTYNGNVEITKENQAEWMKTLKGVNKISGYLYVYGTAQLPALTEVGGYLHVYGTAQLPALTEVGGDLCVDGTAQLPALTEVGGYLRVDGTAHMDEKCESNIGPSVRKRILTKLGESFRRKGYLFADNILSRIVSKRKAGEIVVYKTTKIGNRDKVIYVVQLGEVYSHGETVKQAIHDLRYKLSDRDTTFCAKWTLTSIHPIADIIRSYRCITGACETGTKGFCEGKELPAKLSIKAAIKATEGQYGAREFAKFFSK